MLQETIWPLAKLINCGGDYEGVSAARNGGNTPGIGYAVANSILDLNLKSVRGRLIEDSHKH